MIGTGQILIIVAIVLLLFGGKKIPELMRGLSSAFASSKTPLKTLTKRNPKLTTLKNQKISKFANRQIDKSKKLTL